MGMMEEKAVVSELFSSVRVEIRDEVGFSLLFKSGEQNKHCFCVVGPIQYVSLLHR